MFKNINANAILFQINFISIIKTLKNIKTLKKHDPTFFENVLTIDKYKPYYIKMQQQHSHSK